MDSWHYASLADVRSRKHLVRMEPSCQVRIGRQLSMGWVDLALSQRGARASWLETASFD